MPRTFCPDAPGCTAPTFDELLKPILGELVGIDSSFIRAVLSMYWANYRDSPKKAKVHVGFDINRAIPSKIFLTDGKERERGMMKVGQGGSIVFFRFLSPKGAQYHSPGQRPIGFKLSRHEPFDCAVFNKKVFMYDCCAIFQHLKEGDRVDHFPDDRALLRLGDSLKS